MRWMPRTLRARLLIAIVAVEVAALLLLLPNTVRLVTRTVERLDRQRLQETVPLLTQALARPVFERDIATLEQVTGSIVDRQGVVVVKVRDESGRLLAESTATPAPGRPVPPVMGRELEAPLRIGGRRVGTVQLTVSTAFAQAIKREVLDEGILVALLQIGGSVLVLAFLSLLLTRNLAALHTAANAAATGDLSARAPVRGQDDVAEAVRAFNRMLESLQEAEARQAHNELLYRQLVEQAQQPIAVLDGRKPIFVNAAFARLLGYESPREVTALESIDALIAPEHRDEAAALAAARMAGATAPERHELEVLTPAGGRIWLDSIASPVRWAGREALQLVAFDITERKRAQLALEESEARYRSLVELVPEAIVVHREGRILYANQAAVAAFGAGSREALAGTGIMERIHPEDHELARLRVADLMAHGGSTAATEQRYLRMDGTAFDVEVTGMAIQYEGAPAVLMVFRDITERKAAEEALREGEARFRNIIEGSLQGIALHWDDRYLFVNPAYLRMFGYGSLEELVASTTVMERVAPEYHAELSERYRRRMEGEEPLAWIEFQGVRKEGSRRWFEMTSRATDWRGQPAIQSTLIDITERKQAEHALREAEQRLRSVIENVPVILFTVAPDGTLTFVAGRGLEALGLDADALVGTDYFGYLAGLPDAVADMRRALAGDEVTANRDYGGRTFEVRMQPVRDEAGAMHHVLGVAMDVTARAEAEAARLATEAQFRHLVEGSIQGILIIDAELKIRFANQAAAELHGYDAPEELLALDSAAVLTHPEDRERLRRYQDERLDGEAPPARYEYRGVRKDGSIAWFHNVSTVLDWHGRPAVQAALVDITARVEAEAARRESEARFRDFAEASSDWFWEMDPEGRLTYISEDFERLTGEQREHYLGRRRREIAADAEDAARWADYERMLAAREPLRDFVYPRRTERGETGYLRISGRPRFGEDGEFLGYRGTAADVTAQMAMQAALEVSEARFRDFAEASSDWLWETDADGVFVFASHSSAYSSPDEPQRYLGKRREELALDLHDTEKWERYRRLVAERRPIREFVFHRQGFTGAEDYVRVNGVPMFDREGTFLGYRGTASVITDQVRTQAALEASEARYRDLIEGSLQGVLVLDAHWRIVFANRAAADIYGYPHPEALLALESGARLVHEDDRGRLGEYNAARIRGERRPALYEHRGLRRDGSEVWLQTYVRVVEWDGAPAVQATLVDVTEQRQAEAELRRTEENFRRLIEETELATYILDEDWNLIFLNPSAARLFGYDSPQEAREHIRHGAQLVHEADLERLQSIRQARLQGREAPSSFEFRAVRRDGSVLWLQNVVSVVEWAGRRATMTIAVDVTEHKRRGEELRRRELQFRQLVEDMSLPTIIFDTEWRPVFLNSSAAQLFGYESEAEMLASVSYGGDLLPEEDRAWVNQHRQARLAGQDAPRQYEFRGIRKDGELMWLQNIVAIVEWEGRPASFNICLDVTEHKLREEELRQAQKMEVVGQLTGGVAHDFNNLLTVIIGNLELLRRRVAEDAKLVELLDSAARAAERGATLTQRLLAFSRKQALKPEAVELNRLVMGMADMLRRTLGETIEVETVLAGGLWPALVDPNQLENTLLNLAINARDAMPGGGKMTIETANARLDDEYAALHQEVRPGQYVMLAVSDTGEGMPAEVLERAFDPFFTTKEVGRGSGLGLSMIYGFIKQSGGHVKIYSEANQGTTVKVYLPRAPAPMGVERRPMAMSSPPGRGQKVLVVEDDPSVRELALAILNNLGYTPLAAADGATALELLEAHEDVVLLFTDVVLTGGMSGVDLAAEAARRRTGLKVLYTSGYTENAIIHHGRLDEGVELLEKPFRIDSLARKVQAVLNEK